MNTPQRFFGFLLLPLLTFILGFSLSKTVEFPQGEKFSFSEDEKLLTANSPLDTDAFHSVLASLKKNPGNIDEKLVQRFGTAVESADAIVNQLKKVNLSIFWEALRKIEEEYVDPTQISLENITQGIIRGMVFSLKDPYSTYLSLEESSDFESELKGELDGIGAELIIKNGLVTVVSPLKNSPAAKVGLLPEDVIVKVSGEDIKDQSLAQVVEKIRGEVGTKVTLSVLREGESNILEFPITREHIIVESVHFEMKDSIALLEVNQFGDHTSAEFEKYLRQAIARDAKGVILDLRFNPGGYLETAVEMVSLFVKEGKVVIQEERYPNKVNKFVDGKILTDLPLVVLINKGSASASEIVAGALQDHGRAVIVGESSFGKGTVQEIIPLSDGSNLRITVAKWFTPKGRNIGEHGITPDVMVERTVQDFEEEKDPQLDAALKILKGDAVVSDFKALKEEEEKLPTE